MTAALGRKCFLNGNEVTNARGEIIGKVAQKREAPDDCGAEKGA